MENLDKINVKVDIVLEYNGKVILNQELANLLELTEVTGSLNRSCKLLGIPYSRAWEKILKIENILGKKILEKRKGGVGGGYSKLTDFGKKLLRMYKASFMKIMMQEVLTKHLIIASSHDVLLEHSLNYLMRKYDIKVKTLWLGSSGGLAMIMLDRADIAGTHLYDAETGQYNIPFLRRYWIENKVVLVRGYQREIGLVYRSDVELNNVEDIVLKKLKIVNRNLGSGTRVLLDILLKDVAKKLNMNYQELIRSIEGYDVEVYTHRDVAQYIVEGRADIGLAIRYVANMYGLKFKHIAWENFDFVIPKNRLSRDEVQKFLEFLNSKEFQELANTLPGYRVIEDTGKIIYS